MGPNSSGTLLIASRWWGWSLAPQTETIGRCRLDPPSIPPRAGAGGGPAAGAAPDAAGLPTVVGSHRARAFPTVAQPRRNGESPH
jgi:hypothetical protein